MRCIRCGYDSKYKERSSGQCPSCRKEFAFEPQRGGVMTDAAFKSAIDAVSANGQIRWGVEHLYYEACRRMRRKMLPPNGCIWFCIVVAGILLTAALTSESIAAGIAALIVGVTAFLLFKRRRKETVPLTTEKFNEMWNRWLKVQGTPAGLIVRQEQPARSRRVESDIGDYSFDRAVICDRARTVDMLLANNFHFENNCAVLAIGGYPQGPFETVRAMLKRNPRLQVYVLHDASIAGCKTGYHLVNDHDWFKGHTATIVDVGLRPVHAKPFEGLLIKNQRSAVLPAEGITTEEAEWLSKYTLELAAIRPEQVLRRLFRAINRRSEIPSESYSTAGASAPLVFIDNAEEAPHKKRELDLEFDLDSFGTDASDSDGGADSFG